MLCVFKKQNFLSVRIEKSNNRLNIATNKLAWFATRAAYRNWKQFCLKSAVSMKILFTIIC